jgi:biotin transport system substrate-specific component
MNRTANPTKIPIQQLDGEIQDMTQMEKSIVQAQPGVSTRTQKIGMDLVLVVSASLFVALCAKVSLPLYHTPVPLTLQNFAVLAVGLSLGARRGAMAMGLYLLEGAMGAPVFNSIGLGGLAQIVGPTGGYLMAYPLVAYLTGKIFEMRKKTFTAAVEGAAIAELVLFTSGVSWLMVLTGTPISKAAAFGLYPFVPAEVLKVVAAAAIVTAWERRQAK